MLPDAARSFAEQAPLVLLAMCLFGEARGASDAARRAVAQVVINRARHPHRVFGSRPLAPFEENLLRVILQSGQFSCFLETDPNYAKLLRPLDHERPAVWQHCLDAARAAIASRDQQDSLTLNSDHYFDDSLQPPTWADPAKRTVVIARLRFYRLYLPRPSADAGFLLHVGAEHHSALGDSAVESAAASPSRRASLPPEPSCRAVLAPLRASDGESRRRHRREGFGCGSPASHPAPHHPSQRTPRLGTNRWFSRSRGLSSLPSGFVTGGSGFGGRRSGLEGKRELSSQKPEGGTARWIVQALCAWSAWLSAMQRGAAR